MKDMSKIFGVAIISVLLIGVGASLAMWYDTLLINTYVNTGEVKVEWSNWTCSDTGPDPQAPGFNNTEGKDVGKCIVTVERWRNNNTEPIKLNITLDNVYPGYAVNITLYVDNIGTIPVKLYDYKFTHFDTEDEMALQVRLIKPNSTQIHPNEYGVYILEIIVLQQANETYSYSFDLEMIFAQWNEVQGP